MADDDDALGSFFSEIQEIETAVENSSNSTQPNPPVSEIVVAAYKAPEVIVAAAAPVAASASSTHDDGGVWGAATQSTDYAPSRPTSQMPVGAVPNIARQDKKFVRTGASEVWIDDTLNEWPENDFRLFVGDLGNEVTTEMLAKEFQGKYTSFAKAKVIRTGWNLKSKGYGFVSFLDAFEAAKALREMNGKYIGNRPMRLRKSTWKDRDISEVKKNDKKKKKMMENLGLNV